MTSLLNHIPFTTCPICKAKVKYATQWNQHSNREWNESVEFECGAKHEYSPNIGGPNTTWLCPEDPEAVKTAEVLNKVYTTIGDAFEAQELPSFFKTPLRNRIHEAFHESLRGSRSPKYKKG